MSVVKYFMGVWTTLSIFIPSIRGDGGTRKKRIEERVLCAPHSIQKKE
jgi:hypothetical protein